MALHKRKLKSLQKLTHRTPIGLVGFNRPTTTVFGDPLLYKRYFGMEDMEWLAAGHNRLPALISLYRFSCGANLLPVYEESDLRRQVADGLLPDKIKTLPIHTVLSVILRFPFKSSGGGEIVTRDPITQKVISRVKSSEPSCFTIIPEGQWEAIRFGCEFFIATYLLTFYKELVTKQQIEDELAAIRTMSKDTILERFARPPLTGQKNANKPDQCRP